MAGPTTAERGAEGAAGAPPGRRSKGSGPERGGGARRLPPRPRALLLALAALAFAGGAVWLLYGSPWLRVESVSVSGTRALTPAEVRSAAAVPVGSPLASVDTDAVAERLRRALPRVDSVEVVRSWPHGIGLEVVEREPVLLVRRGGRHIEVDARGVRYATVATAPAGVPLLHLPAGRSPSLRRFGAERLTREAVGVVVGLPEPVGRGLRSVRVRSYDSLTLELRGGRTVFWGSGEEREAKTRALLALMKAAPEAGHFDVSAPSAPAASRS
ncbi:FtsQ-type POTRA domain-containing protein [Streptomyces somaliensis DSM 40738]|uniref:Cell division protein FtsQ n=1 Tax=Streptomyces somaliensis (strain ATCC 33201 / DSM 40738 / JCM 12659 / KCTC 9044 / NCTC 11332 / NRRL B-12077 / IP 733) TaxID=1134445 RepID=A0AA44DE97_STRE0|nr:FtsQ-type POTRA domain-containing protein [Streptomyces somaliensis]MCQ0022369.1 FtsQ-type POTRA domain-containing protein [Streptomyces somaliensis DSM 40738]NKY14805.1 FtsQ-type POTRA domain-containing protein [Streptomyces somaliensis DSM 40738]